MTRYALPRLMPPKTENFSLAAGDEGSQALPEWPVLAAVGGCKPCRCCMPGSEIDDAFSSIRNVQSV